jgi:hypothetical protein
MKHSLPKRRFLLAAVAFSALSLFGCGGTTTTATTSLSVTPVLGAVYGATVSVYNASGVLLGTGTTDTSTGKVSVTLVGYTAGTPVIIKVALAPGATYYSEFTQQVETILPGNSVSLVSVMPAVTTGQAVGVTPLTNMAAKLAGVTADLVGTTPLTTTLTASSIYIAVAKTNLALGLPASTNLTAAPTAATLAAPHPTETMGELLAAMAATTDPVTQAASLLAAVSTNGTVTNAAAIAVVNTILTTTSWLNVTIAAPNTAPDTATLNAAVAAVKTVIDDAVVVAPTPTGTGTGTIGTGG